MRRLQLLLWPAGAALGIAAEAVTYGDPRDWVPDVLTGWALLACGLVAWSSRPRSATGPLLAAAGAAWFAGSLWPAALYLHRGPLVQLVVCYPQGRPRGWVERAAVGAGYAAAIMMPIWDDDVASIILAVAIAVVPAARFTRAGGAEQRMVLPGTAAAVALAAVIAGGAIARLAAGDSEASPVALLAYEATLCALAVSVLAGLVRSQRDRATVADLVVELSQQRSGALRGALASALADPTLEVGYWLPDTAEYVDEEGRPLALPIAGGDRRVTHLDDPGGPLAVLVHDAASLEDAGLVDVVASAARLPAANARLRADVRAQVAEVDASRRRLVRAGDDERRHLERRLLDGAARRLDALSGVLDGARRRAMAGASRTPAKIARAEEQLARTRDELRDLAIGLHPAALTEHGLRGALAGLAARCPIAVDVSAPAERVPADAAVTVYYVCSEALANVVKHAGATRVSVAVTAGPGALVVRIGDDGIGGADPARGSGLRGLADRVEALGGRLEVSSPVGRGTVLVARIPAAPDGGSAGPGQDASRRMTTSDPRGPGPVVS